MDILYLIHYSPLHDRVYHMHILYKSPDLNFRCGMPKVKKKLLSKNLSMQKNI